MGRKKMSPMLNEIMQWLGIMVLIVNVIMLQNKTDGL